MNKPKAPKETEASKWLARISLDAMDRYEKKYYPQEKAFVQDVAASQKGLQQEAVGDAGASTEMAFGREQPGVALGMAQRGVDPSSGRGMATMTGMQQDKGQSKGLGMADARQGANSTYYTNLAKMVNTGKGQQAGAIRGASAVADAANRQSILDARAAAAARNARNQFAGTVGGIGVGYGLDQINRMPQAYNPNSNWLSRGPYNADVTPSFDHSGLQGVETLTDVPRF